MSDLTELQEKVREGDEVAAQKLIRLAYDELRRLAAMQLSREDGVLTLQPTALVHEAWLRLGGSAQPDWESRRHFFGAAAQAMRQILIERARRRAGRKHGGGLRRADDEVFDEVAGNTPGDSVLAVSEALDRFAAVNAEKAELVRLRYFVGLTIDEAAATMGVSAATAKRHWAYARAWLAREIRR